MADLLEIIVGIIREKTGYASGIISARDTLPVESQFPFVGIMDGGDTSTPGASERINTETVFIVCYDQVLGDQSQSVLNVRRMITESREILEGLNFRYIRSQEALTLTPDDVNFIVMKAAAFEIKKREVEL
jgi:hypothetical protein